MDIGYTLGKDLGLFHGHVVEIYFFGSSAHRLCKTGAQGPTIVCGSVSHFPDQSQNRLQMEATFSAARFGWIARPFAPPQKVPSSDPGWLVAADPTFAAPTSALGSQETPGTVASSISPSTGSGGTNDHVVVAAMAVDPPPTRPASPRPAVAAPETDGADAVQSGMDGGLQGLVPNPRRTADRTVDRTGFVQSISFGGTAVARPAMVACARSVYTVVPAFWFASGYPGGQWRPVWIQRPGGADAFECLVDGVGHPSGVYCAGSSRTEWCARTNASGTQSRPGGSCLQHDASSTTANRSLGQWLQWSSSARSAGPANAGGMLPQRPTVPVDQPVAVELSQELEGTQRPQQWADSMAGETSLCRRSLRRYESRIETCRDGQARRVSGSRATGGVARIGCLWSPAFGLRPQASDQRSKSVTYVLASLCYPCPCPVPTPALSPRRGRIIVSWSANQARLEISSGDLCCSLSPGERNRVRADVPIYLEFRHSAFGFYN